MSERKQVEITKEQIEAQEEFIEIIHRKNEDEFNKNGIRKTYTIQTFGCQMHL